MVINQTNVFKYRRSDNHTFVSFMYFDELNRISIKETCFNCFLDWSWKGLHHNNQLQTHILVWNQANFQDYLRFNLCQSQRLIFNYSKVHDRLLQHFKCIKIPLYNLQLLRILEINQICNPFCYIWILCHFYDHKI